MLYKGQCELVMRIENVKEWCGVKGGGVWGWDGMVKK